VRGTSMGAYLRFFSAMKREKFPTPEIFYIHSPFQSVS